MRGIDTTQAAQSGWPEASRIVLPSGLRGAAPGPKGKAEAADLFGTLVRDIMTRKVVTAEPADSLRFAATLLSQKGISGMPVVGKEGQVVGVLSEKDIVKALRDKAGLAMPGGLFELILEPSEARQKDLISRCRVVLDEVRVSLAMTSPAKTIPADSPTVEAAREMIASRINRLPVVERGKLVGIVTRSDVLRLYHGLS